MPPPGFRSAVNVGDRDQLERAIAHDAGKPVTVRYLGEPYRRYQPLTPESFADQWRRTWCGVGALVGFAALAAVSFPLAAVSLAVSGAAAVGVRIVNERAARLDLEEFYAAHPDRRPPRPAPTMNPGIGGGYVYPPKPPPPPAPPLSRYRGK